MGGGREAELLLMLSRAFELKSGLPQGEAYRDVKSRGKKLRQGDN